MKLKIKLKSRTMLIIFIIDLIILIFLGYKIINENSKSDKFAESAIKIYEENEEEVFKVEKIVLCSSANAIDLSEDQNLQNLSIYQYTDIAVYIDNGEELTNKNTIKQLYIDNISFESSSSTGTKSLGYKNLLNFGLKETITEIKSSDKIDFNIVYTNNENNSADYDDATFYTDCSNPITLEYLNYDIVTNYTMDENKTVSFDGSILEDAGVSTDEIECKIIFKINIVNNNDEYYSCWVNIEIPLDDIYEGTTMKAKTTTSSKYTFFKSVNENI